VVARIEVDGCRWPANGMRVDDVKRVELDPSCRSLSSFSGGRTILVAAVMAKPIGFWLSLEKETGIEESRWTSVIAQVSLMLSGPGHANGHWPAPWQNVAGGAHGPSPETLSLFFSPVDGFGTCCIKAPDSHVKLRPPTRSGTAGTGRAQRPRHCSRPNQNKPP